MNSNFRFVESVEAADGRTITVTWKQPFIGADVMFDSGFEPPLPRHLLEGTFRQNKANWENLTQATKLACVAKSIRSARGEAALKHFDEGWDVADVSATASYDLDCVKSAGERLHVEVKGTTSDGSQVLLTRGEVEHAREFHPNVALFVLARIWINEDEAGEVHAVGGEPRVLHPWVIKGENLEALTYRYATEIEPYTDSGPNSGGCVRWRVVAS